MHFSNLVLGVIATAGCVSGAALHRRDELDDLTQQAIANLKTNESLASRSFGKCNIFNAYYRKDWAVFSTKEKLAYINAVKCIQKKPNLSSLIDVPGARNRYDDFVATHINQTLTIHGTANFLAWHRYFTWTYEQVLRNECGYTGYQPYWNWITHNQDQTKSPVFDGSATSMGGDGAYVKHNGSLSGNGHIWLPSGNGGGCVTSGPFADYVVNLGPVNPGMDGLKADPNGRLGYNPRCLKRDITPAASKGWLTLANILNVTLNSPDIARFQNEFQGRFTDGFLGLHAAGHFTMGGEASDLYSSIVDPAFFLHHAMVDRIWWLWQALHLDQAYTISGTVSLLGGANGTLDDTVSLGAAGSPARLGDLLNTFDGPFCYYYL